MTDPAVGAALLVIAKAPVAGRVKTRLCPPLNSHQAAEVATACLLDTLDAAASVPAARHVLVFEGDPGPWLPSGWEYVTQRGESLAERLANAFADVGGPAVVIAMDTPQVEPSSLVTALGLVAEANTAAIGLTEDGGYWALGLPAGADTAAVFADIPMSTPHTGAAQRRRLEELDHRVVVLESLRDVDEYADLRAVAGLVPSRRIGALVASLTSASNPRSRI